MIYSLARPELPFKVIIISDMAQLYASNIHQYPQRSKLTFLQNGQVVLLKIITLLLLINFSKSALTAASDILIARPIDL